MRKLDDEILIDYIFNLLDSSRAQNVSDALKECSESRRRLNQLRQKFQQLDLAASKPQSKIPVLVSAAAAAVLIISFTFFGNNIEKQVSNIAGKNNQTIVYFEIANEDHFSTLPETYTFMAELDSPVLPEQKFNIPEARILPEPEHSETNFEFLRYASSNSQGSLETRSMEYYCTLKLTN